jgi:hypothetical protein
MILCATIISSAPPMVMVMVMVMATQTISGRIIMVDDADLSGQ